MPKKVEKNIRKIVLISIIALASILRLWNISQVPPSASLDEASITYNAYSVLKTGVDEFGDFPLVSQRGYDDWRRSTYLLMVVPFTAILNLSTYSARLPAALLSILTVLATFGIAIRIFKKRDLFAYIFSYTSALLMAISPWHIYISRIGHESNACLSFFVFGMYFFMKSRETFKYLVPAILFFLLSMISYYSGQIFVPVILFALILLYGKDILRKTIKSKKAILVAITCILVTLLAVWAIFSPEALIRYRGTSTLSPEAHPEAFAKRVELRNKAVASGDLIGTILFNRHLFIAQVFFDGYRSHFNFDWLFENKSGGSFKAPNVGLLYLWQLPFILAGIVGLIFTKRIPGQAKILILVWLLAGSLPASVATQAPHAMRSYNIVPAWQLITAFGIAFFLFVIPKYKILAGFLLSILALAGLYFFVHHYFITFPKEQSKSFQYAYAKVIPYILSNESSFKRIVISNQDNLYQSYMLFLYHSKYDPIKYQELGGTISAGYNDTHKIGKYEFRPIEWEKENKKDTLFVGNADEFPLGTKPVMQSRYLNGKVGVIIVKD